jgi:hypothetical protein
MFDAMGHMVPQHLFLDTAQHELPRSALRYLTEVYRSSRLIPMHGRDGVFGGRDSGFSG